MMKLTFVTTAVGTYKYLIMHEMCTFMEISSAFTELIKIP